MKARLAGGKLPTAANSFRAHKQTTLSLPQETRSATRLRRNRREKFFVPGAHHFHVHFVIQWFPPIPFLSFRPQNSGPMDEHPSDQKVVLAVVLVLSCLHLASLGTCCKRREWAAVYHCGSGTFALKSTLASLLKRFLLCPILDF